MINVVELHPAWAEALPAVLRLMEEPQRNLYRQEIQRFLALSRFQREQAGALAPALVEMLLLSARAAVRPAAIAATRELAADPGGLVRLCEAILGAWLDAVDASGRTASTACAPDGLAGEVFFGPRLGGAGRPGAVLRDEP